MKIGLSYDLKEAVLSSQEQPEDALEEYDSPDTIKAIAAAIEAQGYSVVRLGGGRQFLVNILQQKVDLVFNIAEGLGNHRSREAQVPSILEMLDIPYSGSDPQCLAICLDKPLTKKMVTWAGINTPKWQVVNYIPGTNEISWDIFPAFVKPAHEGSSKGIRLASMVENKEQLTRKVSALFEHYQQPVMIEEFITGDEVTVGIVGNHPAAVLGIMRVLPRRKGKYFVYSLEVKRDWEQLVEYECPVHLDPVILNKIKDFSLKAFDVLGCRDFARVDFRINSEGIPHFLEINPLPGLNPHSGDLCIMAKKMGWTYEELISTVLNASIERYTRCLQK